jgi:flagellar biosynthesis GTPase FlhF
MRHLVLTLLAMTLLAGPATALAQEKTDPKEIVIGIVIINMDSEYVMLEVNGGTWDQFYFEDDGMTLVAEGVDRTQEWTFKMTPVHDELKFEEVKVTPKDWKLVRLDKETRQWQARKKLKFKKWKPGEREKFEADQAKKAEEAAKKAEEEAKKKAEEEAAAPEKTEAEAVTKEKTEAEAVSNEEPGESATPEAEAVTNEEPEKGEAEAVSNEEPGESATPEAEAVPNED